MKLRIAGALLLLPLGEAFWRLYLVGGQVALVAGVATFNLVLGTGLYLAFRSGKWTSDRAF